MPLYRGATADLRRRSRRSEWRLAGVLVAGRWHAAGRDMSPPSARLVESGLVCLADLPAFIAPDDRAAVRVALWLARDIPLDTGPHERPAERLGP